MPARKRAVRTRSARYLVRSPGPTASGELLNAASRMHNGPAQYLADALIRLRLCERYMLEDPSQARALLRESVACAQSALDSLRATIHALRAPQGEASGIGSRLRAMVAQLRSRTTAEFCVTLDDVGPWPRDIDTGLATVGCEAITNAAKHADARHITVDLGTRKGAIILEVKDDGKGFDYTESLGRGDDREGLGLALIGEQIQRLGGTLSIRSGSGGTCVRAVVPWLEKPGLVAAENAQAPGRARA